MRICIDISQIVYEGTGVSNYVKNLVSELVKNKSNHKFILLGFSLRKRKVMLNFFNKIHAINPNVEFKYYPIPISIVELVWNRFNFIPVEFFSGEIDIFWSSDWTQPSAKNAKLITTIHDLSPIIFTDIMTNKKEKSMFFNLFSHDIAKVQKRRLERVKSFCKLIFCDSKSTKNDVIKYLKINPDKLSVIYPGF